MVLFRLDTERQPNFRRQAFRRKLEVWFQIMIDWKHYPSKNDFPHIFLKNGRDRCLFLKTEKIAFLESVVKYQILNGAPEEIRTPDPQIRSLVLYPAELRVHFWKPPKWCFQPVPSTTSGFEHLQSTDKRFPNWFAKEMQEKILFFCSFLSFICPYKGEI